MKLLLDKMYAPAIADDRVLVSENVQDFRRLETDALARARPRGPLILTTDRQFPRGDPATIGRLVTALGALLAAEPDLVTPAVPEACLTGGRFVPHAPTGDGPMRVSRS